MMNGYHHQEFEHPQLGLIVGRRRNEHVVQFRTIPYARVPVRFRQAELMDQLPSKQRSFTEYTYACPQTEQSMEPFGGPIVGQESRRYDELSCLNLTVTMPAALLEPGCTEKVPVMVYVHGGGFTVGAHYGGPHDMTRMATQACQDSKPVIIDLMNEAEKNNEKPCNFALYDQRLAFLWVQRFISGFGGDVNRITAFGESAGSASLCFHLSSNVPLFNRVILQSGTAAAISPAPLASKENEYLALLKFCEIREDDPQRLEKLRAVPTAKIVEAATAITKAAFSPLAHESFFPIIPNYINHSQIVSECPWVDAVITGDAVFEGYLFAYSLSSVSPGVFCKHVEDTLGAEKAQQVLEAYGISRNMDQNLFWTRLCILCGDVMFSAPCHNMSKKLATSNKQFYRYTLSLRNPFPGSIFSNVLGHHFVELIYQFMMFTERFPLQKQREISLGFVQKWTAFAYGQEPWTPYTGEDETIAVADSLEGWIVRTRVEDLERSAQDEGGQRRYKQWEALDEVFQGLDGKDVKAAQALRFPILATLSAR
ncbi:hypothetical protein FDECE_7049 [Fusarium decemcellulare]|nr:hypothetical protein FDECE_7049 [Fusarium decemcellulare]